mmetsp:Transcript_50480/g.157626  ORF Transcript_50480/g.157626 Transcript_50480/m.157626 type:complete len:239 (+) Transcript_50480:1769-2485(+)
MNALNRSLAPPPFLAQLASSSCSALGMQLDLPSLEVCPNVLHVADDSLPLLDGLVRAREDSMHVISSMRFLPRPNERLRIFLGGSIPETLVPRSQHKVSEWLAVVRCSNLAEVSLISRHHPVHEAVFPQVSPVSTIQEFLVHRRVPLPVIKVIMVSAREFRHSQPDRNLFVFAPNDFVSNLVVVTVPVHGLHATLSRFLQLLAPDISHVLFESSAVHQVLVLLGFGRHMTEVIDTVGS